MFFIYSVLLSFLFGECRVRMLICSSLQLNFYLWLARLVNFLSALACIRAITYKFPFLLCRKWQDSVLVFILDQVYESLVESTKDIEGAKVENNKFCVSVHYRNVDEKVVFFKSSNLINYDFEVFLFYIKNKLSRGSPFFCYSFYFRFMFTYFLLSLQSWPAVAQCVHDVLKDYPRLRLTHGRKVFFKAKMQADLS